MTENTRQESPPKDYILVWRDSGGARLIGPFNDFEELGIWANENWNEEDPRWQSIRLTNREEALPLPVIQVGPEAARIICSDGEYPKAEGDLPGEGDLP